MNRRSSSPKQTLTTSATQLTTIKKETKGDFKDEKRFKLELNSDKSFNLTSTATITNINNSTTTTAYQNNMSNGITKTPPNHPIPTSFHHLLAGGPLFGTMPSHSTNQNSNMQAAFNPGKFFKYF